MRIVLIAIGAILLCRAEDPPFYTDKSNLLVYLNGNKEAHPVYTRADWDKRRRHIVANMELLIVMGPLPERKQAPLDVVVLEEVRFADYSQKKLTYVSERGDRVPAYVLIPHRRERQLPAVVCLHPSAKIGEGVPIGLGDRPNRQYAQELTQRGYVTLSPDYPYFGDYHIDPYAMGYESATMKGIVNHMRAVDLLESLPEVAPNRIGAIGHSLGGHNALFLAVFEPRIRAVVTSCGFNVFSKHRGGDVTAWSRRHYMPRIETLYGNVSARIPFEFTEVLTALAPRPVFINARCAMRPTSKCQVFETVWWRRHLSTTRYFKPPTD